MPYSVEVIADSISPNRIRISSLQLKYPARVHKHLLTHRALSRNASSTRAIPVAKMIEWVEKDPALPVFWGRNQKGMQSREELDAQEIEAAKAIWLQGRDSAVAQAKALDRIGAHKQTANDLLEPYAHINVIVTATNFDNFFGLRCHKDTKPETQVLAVKMARQLRDSKPTERPDQGKDSWHLPYVTDEERAEHRIDVLLQLSVARCARVSYFAFDGKRSSLEKDIELHGSLLRDGHYSPFEHQAKAQYPRHKERSGNFLGWSQYRQAMPTSVHTSFDYNTLDQFEGRDFIV